MTLMIGTESCSSRACLKDYFPDDIPEEWKLDYYSNDFPILLITQNCWLNSDFLTYIEDSEPCKLLIEINFPFKYQSVLNQTINKLGVYFYGIVVKYNHERNIISAINDQFSSLTSHLFLIHNNNYIINKKNYTITVNANATSIAYYYVKLNHNATMSDLVTILDTVNSGILIVNTSNFNALQNIMTLKQSIL